MNNVDQTIENLKIQIPEMVDNMIHVLSTDYLTFFRTLRDNNSKYNITEKFYQNKTITEMIASIDSRTFADIMVKLKSSYNQSELNNDYRTYNIIRVLNEDEELLNKNFSIICRYKLLPIHSYDKSINNVMELQYSTSSALINDELQRTIDIGIDSMISVILRSGYDDYKRIDSIDTLISMLEKLDDNRDSILETMMSNIDRLLYGAISYLVQAEVKFFGDGIFGFTNQYFKGPLSSEIRDTFDEINVDVRDEGTMLKYLESEVHSMTTALYEGYSMFTPIYSSLMKRMTAVHIPIDLKSCSIYITDPQYKEEFNNITYMDKGLTHDYEEYVEDVELTFLRRYTTIILTHLSAQRLYNKYYKSSTSTPNDQINDMEFIVKELIRGIRVKLIQATDNTLSKIIIQLNKIDVETNKNIAIGYNPMNSRLLVDYLIKNTELSFNSDVVAYYPYSDILNLYKSFQFRSEDSYYIFSRYMELDSKDDRYNGSNHTNLSKRKIYGNDKLQKIISLESLEYPDKIDQTELNIDLEVLRNRIDENQDMNEVHMSLERLSDIYDSMDEENKKLYDSLCNM